MINDLLIKQAFIKFIRTSCDGEWRAYPSFKSKAHFSFFFLLLVILFTMSDIANGIKEFVKKTIADNKVTVRLPLCRE